MVVPLAGLTLRPQKPAAFAERPLLKITIVLPKYFNFPIGGYKVQYEYANRLAARGHTLTLVLPRGIDGSAGWMHTLGSLRWKLSLRRHNKPLIGWFPLSPQVRVVLAADLRPQNVPDADVVIATNWHTAEKVRFYPPRKGVKFYMVYDYEFWKTTDPASRARMEVTYRAGLHVISTSPAVDEMLAQNDCTPVAYLPCGLDFKVYGMDVPIAQRTWGTIGIPLRQETFKGTVDALEALRLLKQRHGDKINVKSFGSFGGAALPDWVTRLPHPTDAELRTFYNSLSMFLFPSHYEGWGLTGMEALACGAALVASDSVGLRDYARDGETALLVPPKRPDLLADAVERLLSDEGLRQSLARQGNAHVQQFHWQRAVDGLEEVLHQYC